jgi:branched-chain amino acid transport system substrate-binding protein
MRKRSLSTVVAIAAVAAVALTACGSSKSGSKAKTGSSSGKTYTIAYQGPLSGGNAQLGLNMTYAVQLAVNQANSGTSQFGKLPFTLKYTKQDDQGSATQAPTAAQALIGDSNVVAVVGPAFSGATKASGPFYSQANLATVSPSATAPDLANNGWKNFFRVVADDNAQGPADAEYLSKVVKATNVYVVDDASAYAAGLASSFKGAAGSNNLKIESETAPGTTQCQAGNGNVQQYDALASKIKNANPQAVFYAGYYCDFALLAKALKSGGYTGTLMSDDGSLDPKYVSQAGASVANGTLISCACSTLGDSAAATKFTSEFKSLAGFDVGTYSAEAYDAANAIITVMKKISDDGGAITRDSVVTGLGSVDYKGLTKEVKFESNGNIAGTAVYVNKVENGTITQLGLVSDLAK